MFSPVNSLLGLALVRRQFVLAALEILFVVKMGSPAGRGPKKAEG
jgi:hypothetical protein